MIRYLLILFLFHLSLTITSCSSNRDTAEYFGIARTWEVNLTQGNKISTHKGQVVFKENRYVYTWHQQLEDSNTQSTEWSPVEMEQGNIINEKPGVMALLTDSYGTPAHSDNAKNSGEIDYEIKPSKSDYLIHYKI